MRVLMLAFAAFVSCATPPSDRPALSFAVASHEIAAPALGNHASRVILVTLDGARWQEIFLGVDRELASRADLARRKPEELMPTLHRWMSADGMAIGAPGHGEIWASGPNYVSLPGYTEILTGRPSACQTNDCDAIREPTLVDELFDAKADAVVVSSWERIERVAARDRSHATLSAGRHAVWRAEGFDPVSLEEGKHADALPGVDDYRRDELTMRVALGALDHHAPRFLWVGLGDPDEHAHRGDYARYLASLRAADGFLAEIEKRIDDQTVVLVTADHGRSHGFRDHGGFPESGRVWLVARAGGATPGYADSPTLHLADVAPTIRCLMGLRADNSPSAGHSIAALCDEASTE
jgi:hypothetical protein